MQLRSDRRANSRGRGGRVAAEVRWRCAFMELKVFPEHPEKVLFEAHHEGMNPGVEKHICAFETHLGGVARWKVLDVNWRRNHRARHSKTLCDVPFHLGTEHQLGLQLGDPRFNVEVVIGDQRFDPIQLGRFANLAGKFPAVGA